MAHDGPQVMLAQFRETAELLGAMAGDGEFMSSLSAVAQAWIEAISSGHKIMLAGNGGSAADAQHVAGELVNRFNFERPAMAGLALSTDTSVLTCIGNDSSFDEVFSRQIEALGRPGDVFCAISTSGNSPNILRAIEAARAKSILVVGFTGSKGGAMKEACDHCVQIPHDATPRIQEGHLCCYHAICAIVEESLFGGG